MKELIFGTSNQNKVKEVNALLPHDIKLLGLKDLGRDIDLPETSDTIEDNAIEKATYLYQISSKNCFAEDSGLCVDALGGDPGVFSARYAGKEKDDKKNLYKLLENLDSMENRSAFFVTAIALYWNGRLHTFKGKVYGHISHIPKGHEGFGYDPVFIPKGYQESFAQLGDNIKNKISHRAKAVQKLIQFLKTN